MNALVDMTGRVVNGVQVIKRQGHLGDKPAWLCRCTCGSRFIAAGTALRRGRSQRCPGCTSELRRANATVHGGVGRPEYVNWSAMKGRCYNPNDSRFAHYGGRGITVCERWLASFAHFLADMGPIPGPDYSIERLDRDEGYSPENCTWATRVEQANNRSNNTLIEIGGRTQTLTQWSRETGINRTVILRRMKRGFTGESLIKKGILK